jgi:CHAT domain-containing protein
VLHLGGCRNVVASLWKVDDDAIATLQALRQAQLSLMRHPHEVALLARERGPNFDKIVKGLEATPSQPDAGREGATAPARHWAAFVLSGTGR